LGQKLPGNPPGKLKNQDEEQKNRSSVGTSPENFGQKIENFPKKVMDIRRSKHFRPFSHFDRCPPCFHPFAPPLNKKSILLNPKKGSGVFYKDPNGSKVLKKSNKPLKGSSHLSAGRTFSCETSFQVPYSRKRFIQSL
jgi:hypothetical protein